jgi:hypothetical protein
VFLFLACDPILKTAENYKEIKKDIQAGIWTSIADK